MPKQGKVPYKDVISQATLDLFDKVRGKIRSEINGLFSIDEIVANFYTDEEKELLEKVDHFYPVDNKDYSGIQYYPQCMIAGYFPNHRASLSRTLEVFTTKLKNSEQIVQLINQLKYFDENIDADRGFLMGLDNKTFGENLFRYAPIIKKLLTSHQLSKFSDKAKNTPPAPEAYQWKLTGISTALTYLELSKD